MMGPRAGLHHRSVSLFQTKHRQSHVNLVGAVEGWQAHRRTRIRGGFFQGAKWVYNFLHIAIVQYWLLLAACTLLSLVKPKILRSVDTPVIAPSIALCSFGVGCHLAPKLCWVRAKRLASNGVAILRLAARVTATLAVCWYLQLPRAYISGLLVAAASPAAPWYKSEARFALHEKIDLEKPFSKPDVPVSLLLLPVVAAVSSEGTLSISQLLLSSLFIAQLMVVPLALGYVLNGLSRNTLKPVGRAAAGMGHFMIAVASIKCGIQSFAVAGVPWLLLLRASAFIGLSCVFISYAVSRLFGACSANCMAISLNTVLMYEPLGVAAALLLFPDSLAPLACIVAATMGSVLGITWASVWRLSLRKNCVSNEDSSKENPTGDIQPRFPSY